MTTKDFSQRAAIFVDLFDRIRAQDSGDDEELVWDFIERNDAHSFVVLGDPAPAAAAVAHVAKVRNGSAANIVNNE